ncbi:hypothetical protein SAMN05216505_11087 [Streptomyces prasinopilosus]|nr:hypothetical protein SAMN05216505_11087 [Streptomyces prasinopilosus]
MRCSKPDGLMSDALTGRGRPGRIPSPGMRPGRVSAARSRLRGPVRSGAAQPSSAGSGTVRRTHILVPMYFTDRGIEELEKRRGEEEVTFEWLAEQLRTFVDLNPDFEVPVERLATWLARLDDDEDEE